MTASATTTYTARGTYEGYAPKDQEKVNRCLLGVTKKLPIQWPKLTVPDPTKIHADRLGHWLRSAFDRLDHLVDVGYDRDPVQEARHIIELQLPR